MFNRQFTLILMFCSVLLPLFGLATTPAASAPAGLTAAEWAQIQSQLPAAMLDMGHYTQTTKLLAADGAGGDQFGHLVAMDGDTAVVSSHYDDDEADNSGSAYVFVRSGTTWSQQAKLTASDGDNSDHFSYSLDISGDTIVVGSFLDDDHGGGSGSAYVFVRSGTTWSQQAKLTASDAAGGDNFGVSVAVSGDTIVVGASRDAGGGSAYIFVRSGSSWSQQAKLTASDAADGDEFGFSVTLEGDTAVAGARQVSGNSGAVYVFVRSGTSWSQQAKLTASDSNPWLGFGHWVDLSGETIISGAYDDWLTPSTSAAYIFVRSGTTWSEQAKLTASDGGETFGIRVAIEEDTAVVLAWFDDENGLKSGAAYVFNRSGTTWSEIAKLEPNDPAVGDQFGIIAAISDSTIVVGSLLDDDNGSDSGSAYVFDLLTSPLTVTTTGTGAGEVSSQPAGIDCGADCAESFTHGTVVTLTAVAEIGSTFAGWSGSCTGTGNCVLTITQAEEVTTTFTLNSYELAVDLAGTGLGEVSSQPAGIDCGADCGESFTHGTVVTLTAVAEIGSTFAGWSGGCTGMGNCVLTITQAEDVTATFTLNSYELAVDLAGTGAGEVSSQPAGIECGADCAESFTHGTVVTLTAVAEIGSTFAGWSGGCTGLGNCVLTITQAEEVTATFTLEPQTSYMLYLPVIYNSSPAPTAVGPSSWWQWLVNKK